MALVSIPLRYAKNEGEIADLESELEVSIPLRYAKNWEYKERCKKCR